MYIHIGRNKTGSTAIQEVLASNRPGLEAQGFVYPGQERCHAALALHLNERQRTNLSKDMQSRVDQLSETLKASIASAQKTPIISSEGLQNIKPQALRAWLPPQEVVIVVYLREQAEYLWSFYSQAVKARKITENFEEFIRNFNVDYLPFLASWSAAFDRVIVRPYDRGLLRNGDAADDFLFTVGVDPSGFDRPPEDPNPSIGGALLEAKRRINGLQIPESQLREATYQILLKLARQHPEYRGSAALPANVAGAIRLRYAESNTEVSRKYNDGSKLFCYHHIADPPIYDEEDVRTAIEMIAVAVEDTARDIASTILSLLHVANANANADNRNN